MHHSSIIGYRPIGQAIIGSSGTTGDDPYSGFNNRYPYRNLDTLNASPIDGFRICVVGSKDSFLKPKDLEYKAESKYQLDHVVMNMNLGNWKEIEYKIESDCYLFIGVGEVSMVQWDQFYEYVMPSVIGCPVSIVQNAIRSAAIEFCEKSLIWRQDSLTTTIMPGESLYKYAPPYDAKVVMPYYVSIYGKPLKAFDLRTLDTYDPLWRERTSDLPDAYVQVFDDTIQLIGEPTKQHEDALTAGVVFKPSRDSASCPSFIYNDWAETVAAGALAKLHAMSNKIWAVPSLVDHFTRKFREGISRASSKAEKSWQRESKNMLYKDYYNPRGLITL